MREEVGRGVGEFARDQVRAVHVLGCSTKFEGHQVVQTRFQPGHQATQLGLVHEIACGSRRQAGDCANICQGERGAVQLIELGQELRGTRTQRLGM